MFWALVLVLLGFALGWARQRSCSVPDVLHHYRAVIFEDLHAAMRQVKPEVQRTGLGSRRHHLIRKNLTGDSEGLGRPEVSCGTQEVWRGRPTHVHLLLPSMPLSPSFLPFPPKEHSILLSIKSLGRTLRGAVAGDRRGALEKAAWTVAIRTEAVMRRHCWTPPQVCA